MKYGRRYMNRRQPTLEELRRARDCRYICPLDGYQFQLNDQSGPASCPKCGRTLQPRTV